MQGQTTAQSPTDPNETPLTWKTWKHDHPEFRRESQTIISYEGDKIIIIGGYEAEGIPRKFDLILMDPENEKFKIIPSVGNDVDSCCWGDMSACYWKDSKVVAFGGYDYKEERTCSTVAIVTLRDLDSENPSAHWEKIVTPTEYFRSGHAAHIYKDKMYVFGGKDNEENDVWCLDLTEFTWSQCHFTGRPQEKYSYSFIFNEQEAYAFYKGRLTHIETMKTFNFETMSSQLQSIPRRLTDQPFFDAFPRVMDEKIYFFENGDKRSKEDSLARKVLALDLNSKEWIEIKTESSPDLNNKIGRVFCYNNHLVFNPIVDTSIDLIFGEFWSLPLNPQRPSKYSSTSTAVNKVQQTMKEFFFEAPYSDISFEVESQSISAHKWVLIQRNKYFANILSSELSGDQTSKIIINDFKAPTFRALLEYLYSDHVEIDDTIALELLQQADKYSIPGELKTACEKHLIKNIEPENYVAFGKLAESVGAPFLRDAVVVFIAKNMKKIKPRKDFNEISDALLRDSIVKFIVK